MPYMLLIIEPVGQRLQRGREAGEQVYARMLAYTDELKREGVLMNSSSLASTAEATRLQLRDGRQTLVDGPFAETKEMVGGFFLLNCDSRDAALAFASRCPAAEWATVEVRGVAACFESL